jgi:hypothetical protein
MFESILLIGIAGCLAWLVLRMFPRRNETQAGSSGASHRTHPYHSVSIHTGSAACLQARGLRKKRFLSGEAPQLPLAECTSPKCHCVYQHHPDRRSGNGDRRSIGSTASGMLRRHGNRERRLSRGRREFDKDGDLSWV